METGLGNGDTTACVSVVDDVLRGLCSLMGLDEKGDWPGGHVQRGSLSVRRHDGFFDWECGEKLVLSAGLGFRQFVVVGEL